ncbi:hypothetical protein QVD17_25290 [Tagetes erecta]|uniref:Uncharacterized protein n=1 Tax=Tagetes erecta TaxID=13708 RepID=A0AAD8KIV0_TARER|nr:hypothetical protein QVD17_25290 [Tagetes erecta]
MFRTGHVAKAMILAAELALTTMALVVDETMALVVDGIGGGDKDKNHVEAKPMTTSPSALPLVSAAPPTKTYEKKLEASTKGKDTSERVNQKRRKLVPKFSDPPLCETYAHDINQYLHTMEGFGDLLNEARRRPMVQYITQVQQNNVTVHMRVVLIDWLVEVAQVYNLLSETLFLTVSYIDRLLSTNALHRNRLQLLAVSSMLIASKYEEVTAPGTKKFSYITDNSYTRQEIVEMESAVLKALNYEMGNPTLKSFLRRLTQVAQQDFENLSLEQKSGYKQSDLKECVQILHELQLSRRAGSFLEIRKKFKQGEFECVSNLQPPEVIPIAFSKDVKDLGVNEQSSDLQTRFIPFCTLRKGQVLQCGFSSETYAFCLTLLIGESHLRRKDCTVIDLFKCLPMIEHLTICYDVLKWLVLDSVRQELPALLFHLKYFCFNEMSFADGHGLAFLLVLIKCSPNLEKIKLEFKLLPTGFEEYPVLWDEYSDVWLEHLNELDIKCFSNSKHEMKFVKFILARSPRLKTVSIIRSYASMEERLEMLQVLLRGPRASQNLRFRVRSKTVRKLKFM